MKKTMINLRNTLTLFFPFSGISRFTKLRSLLQLEELIKARNAKSQSAPQSYPGMRGVVKTAH
jgi:hypothetical protein